MINLCFSEGTKGSLKYAFRSRGEQVACLPLLLFWGDIRTPFDIESRKRVYEMFRPEYIELVESNLWEFKMLTGKDKNVRIWYSSAESGEYCGLLHAVSHLRDCNLTVVDCNRDIVSGKVTTQYSNTTELAEEVFVDFLQYEYSPQETQIQEWKDCFAGLQAKNAPLRVIDKKMIISAGIDYYDKFIEKQLSPEKKSVARIIGDVIGYREIGGIPCSDTFIAGRIQDLLDRGILELVTQHEDFYRSAVRLAGDNKLI